MHDIEKLGNQQLRLHHEKTNQELNDIKIAIVDDITDLLWIVPVINDDTYENTEKFLNYCKEYQLYIENEKKNLFVILIQQQKDIKEEIKKRQLQMIKEIGIITPSIRVMMILKQMEWNNFQMFDHMIRYIKLAKKWKADKRPKEKQIYAPIKLIETFEKIWTSLLVVLANNSWPLGN